MLIKTTHTPSVAILLTLTQAKAQLRLDDSFDAEDDLLDGYIAAVQEDTEQYLGRPLAQTSVFEYDGFEAIMEVPALQNAAITKVEYLAAGDDGETYVLLASSGYTFTRDFENGGYLLAIKGDIPETYTSDAAVKVTVAVTCPKPVVQAMLLKITDAYEKREDITAVTFRRTSTLLLDKYRQNW